MTMMLNSFGLALGVTPWTVFAGSISLGRYEVFNGAQLIQQNAGFVNGTTYDFSFDYDKDVSGGNPALRINNGATNGANIVYTSGVLSNGPHTLSGSFVAAGPYFTLEASNALYPGRIDNVVVTVSGGGPNLIQDGTFDIPS